MKACAIQFCPSFKQKAENIRRLAKLVAQAAREGAQLIVMPEMAVTGYSFMGFDDANPLAEVIAGFRAQEGAPIDTASSMSVMAALAKRLKVHLVWGLIEKDPGTGLLYNSQVYMDPAGYFESYRKVNLWGNDMLWATEGRGNPPVIQRAGPFAIEGDPQAMVMRKLGLLICRDVRDRKDDTWSNFYSAGDADVVAFSTAWGDGGFPATAWVDFARDNRCWLVVANRYGYEIPNDFGEGGSCIISPEGKVQIQGLVFNADCIVHGTVG